MFVLLPASDSIDMEMLSFADFIIIPKAVGQLDEEKKLEIFIDEDESLTYLYCIVQSIMGRHYYTTSCISHLIFSRFKVKVQHVQMVHTLNSIQNGGYKC